MTRYKYAHEYQMDKHARALGRDLPISLRSSSEICRQLRFKPIDRAKRILQNTIEMKKPIPFNRFAEGAGHKPGMRGGQYPIKACTYILRILESAEANAHNKGLAKDLKVIHVIPQKASKAFHPGRQGRRKFKRTHIEVVLGEYKKEEVKSKSKKSEAKKPEAKKQ